MITTYHRPKTLDEALTLLSQPNRIPLGGGTLLSHASSSLSASPTADPVEVVDLQALSLDSVNKSGNNLEVGATVTLQQLLASVHCPDAMKSALKLEAPLNIRNTATVAGTIVTCDGRSTFTSALLALDAKLELRRSADSQAANLGDFLPLRPRGLITSITIPLNVKLAFEYVSRTPADKPIVCAALTQWNSGRTRLVLGGWGKIPLLAMDGTDAHGIDTAARNAFHEAADDYASAEYRMDAASTLVKRCISRLNDSSTS
ncbi:MAG TPA: FAD binding domain-containing protein [Anaerolineales bacterium]|nr:FAD binding domain-containing protein [Anaerolineales bacterium]